MGSVSAIFVTQSAAAPMRPVDTAQLEAGLGIVGDRYHAGAGTWSRPGREHDAGRQVTLIEAEAVEAVAREHDLAFAPRDARRNIVTRGVALNDLVGAEFTVGRVRLRGIELCEPCSHLQDLVGDPVLEPLVHRGGLRCDVLDTGTVRVGDTLTVPPGGAPH